MRCSLHFGEANAQPGRPRTTSLELDLQHPPRVGVTHLGVVEDGHAKGVFLLEIAKLHVVLAACHELPPEDTGTHPVLVHDLGRDVAAVPGVTADFERSNYRRLSRAIDLLGETRCCGPPLLSDPPFILADEVGSYSLHRTSYLPRR